MKIRIESVSKPAPRPGDTKAVRDGVRPSASPAPRPVIVIV